MNKIIYEGIEFTEPDFDDRRKNRTKTLTAILNGKLIRKPCVICGNEMSVAHHEKYSDYLNVKWLCYSHHSKIHRLFRMNKNCIKTPKHDKSHKK